MQAYRYDVLMNMLKTGKLAPQKLIGRHIGLDEAPAALMEMNKFGGIGITVVTRF
jgi:alcohol dehydrogenase